VYPKKLFAKKLFYQLKICPSKKNRFFVRFEGWAARQGIERIIGRGVLHELLVVLAASKLSTTQYMS
jgi:hypothetical protein